MSARRLVHKQVSRKNDALIDLRRTMSCAAILHEATELFDVVEVDYVPAKKHFKLSIHQEELDEEEEDKELASRELFEEGSVASNYKAHHHGEEWHVVDTLFSYLDKDDSGTLEADEVVHALRVIGEKNPMKIFEGAMMEANQTIDREDLYSLLFNRRDLTAYHSVNLFIVAWMLPLFYSLSTRLPFICLALEVLTVRMGALWQVGVVLGSYQTCRSLANLVISQWGGTTPLKRLNIPMVFVGLLGWTLAWLSPFGNIWELMAVAITGFSESVVSLQSALIEETRKESPAHVADPAILTERLRSQYSAISAGSFIAYVAGGLLYTHFGFAAVAALGMGCQAVQVLGTILYLIGDRGHKKGNGAVDGLVGSQLLRSIVYRIQAIMVLAKEAENVSVNSIEEKNVTEAAKSARNDVLLTNSLKQLYREFFEGSAKSHVSNRRSSFHRETTTAAMPIQRMLDLSSSEGFTMAGFTMAGFTMAGSHLGNKDFAKLAVLVMDADGDGNVSEKEFCSFLAPRVFLSFFGHASQNQVKIVWPYLKAVVATQAVMALCIGVFLSTSLLFYTEKWDLSASSVGLLLGTGEGLGSLVIYISGTMKPIREFVQERRQGFLATAAIAFSRPLHVPLVLLVLGGATMSFTANSFIVAVVFQMLMSAINDLSVTLLNELIATSLPPEQFRKYQGLGQWLRRLGNMSTGFLGPVLFGISHELPFFIFGGVVLAWSLVLWAVLLRHMIRITPTSSKMKAGGRGPVSAFRAAVHTPWNALETIYYVENKDEIDETFRAKDVTLDLAEMDYRIRRLGAALKAEAAKRELLQKELEVMVSHIDV